MSLKHLLNFFLLTVHSSTAPRGLLGKLEGWHQFLNPASAAVNLCIREICEMPISDHLPVLFTVTLPCARDSTWSPVRRLRALNPLTALQFSVAFTDSMLPTSDLYNASAEKIRFLPVLISWTLLHPSKTDALNLSLSRG